MQDNRTISIDNVTRWIWYPVILKKGHIITFQGKTYEVVDQGHHAEETAYFSRVYKTTIREVK